MFIGWTRVGKKFRAKHIGIQKSFLQIYEKKEKNFKSRVLLFPNETLQITMHRDFFNFKLVFCKKQLLNVLGGTVRARPPRIDVKKKPESL